MPSIRCFPDALNTEGTLSINYLQLEETKRGIEIEAHQKINRRRLYLQHGSLIQLNDCRDTAVVRGNGTNFWIVLLYGPRVFSHCDILTIDFTMLVLGLDALPDNSAVTGVIVLFPPLEAQTSVYNVVARVVDGKFSV